MKAQTAMRAKRVLTFIMAAAIVGAISADSGVRIKTDIVSAHADESSKLSSEAQKNEAAIAGQEADLAELEKKQAELDEKIKSTEGDISAEEENQKAIREQISTVESTLHKLAESITTLEDSITAAQLDIEKNEGEIEKKKGEIQTGVEQLNKRLRVMYIAGNDSYSQILIGASDFYDMLMKLEMIKRVANHDNELIDGLIELKEDYETEEKTLAESKKKLEADLADLEERRSKQKAQMKKLEDLYSESSVTLQNLANDKALYEGNREQIEKEHEQFEKDLADLLKKRKKIADDEEKQRQEEEKRKQREEEERKKQEEEERRKKEEEERRKQEEQENQNQNNNNNNDSETPAPPKQDDSSAADPEPEPAPEPEPEPDPAPSGGDPNAAYGYVPKSRFTWPVPGYYHISYGVGWRWGAYHKGIDIWSEGIRGHDIVASDDGTVILVSNTCPHDYGKDYSCGCGGGYGNYCIIDHGDGYWTLYGHSERITVSEGDYVLQGDKLGTVGSTGHSTGPHLHFEVRLNGVALDPEDYV